jgi:hypothetical protein
VESQGPKSEGPQGKDPQGKRPGGAEDLKQPGLARSAADAAEVRRALTELSRHVDEEIARRRRFERTVLEALERLADSREDDAQAEITALKSRVRALEEGGGEKAHPKSLHIAAPQGDDGRGIWVEIAYALALGVAAATVFALASGLQVLSS